MNAITVMIKDLVEIPDIQVNYYTRAKFIKKLHEVVLNEKFNPLPFPKPPYT